MNARPVEVNVKRISVSTAWQRWGIRVSGAIFRVWFWLWRKQL